MPAKDIAKLSTKFQITIPKAVRAARRWRAGQEFAFIPKGDAVLLVPVPKKRTSPAWRSAPRPTITGTGRNGSDAAGRYLGLGRMVDRVAGSYRGGRRITGRLDQPPHIALVEDAATQSRLPIGDLAQQKFNSRCLPAGRRLVSTDAAAARTERPGRHHRVDGGRGHRRLAIDLRITRLRRKIEVDPAHPEAIRTVRGVGYMFVPPPI